MIMMEVVVVWVYDRVEEKQKAALQERVKERKEELATKLVTDIDYERKDDKKKALLKASQYQFR